MNWIRKRVLNGEPVIGTWLGLGSPTVAEIAGQIGFDWLLIDMEHGSGDEGDVLGQLQALSGSKTSPIVRVAANNPALVKRALDLGAAGIMVPWVNSAAEAQAAVSAMRYPPLGIRGVSGSVRAANYGRDAKNYFQQANENLLTVVQIETAQAVEQAHDIAALDGVDVLFIGPADLTASLGIPSQLDHPDFQAACHKILTACKKSGKQAGILLKDHSRAQKALADGFHFLAFSSDIAFLNHAMQNALTALKPQKA
jgi:2-keto-3-deoxy-L-rhamnonate aldolase RhmA